MSIQPPPQQNFIEALRSRIVEGRTILPEEFRPVAIPLQVTLGTTRQQGTANFNIPTNQRMMIRQLLPICVPVDASAAGDSPNGLFTGGGAIFNPAVVETGTVEDVLLSKMGNCRIDLGINSRMSNLFPRLSFPLGSVSSWFGEDFSFADVFGILVQGTSIDLTASLTDLAAAGADTQYGVVVCGAYVNV